MREVNFNEKMRNEFVKHVAEHDYISYIKVAMDAKEAILDLILKVNADNYNSDGEPINDSCRLDAEALENISHLIKYGNFYETTNQ